MGALTDLVVVRRKDADKVCKSAAPARDFEGLAAKGIDAGKLGSLHALLSGADCDASTIAGAPLSSGGSDGPWVTEISPDLVKRLAALKPAERRKLAATWSQAEEFRPPYGNWKPEAVHDALEKLAKLCSRAVTEKKSLLMWTSL